MKCRRCMDVFEYDDLDEGTCAPCEIARAASVPPLDVEAVFGPAGPLAKPGYEARPGQVKLSRAIFDALAGGHHLQAEGPCGIGKSKAYGVPAAYLASKGKKVLIVTASIALQEQLVHKDLPDLARELPFPFTFALMKGKGNYLCKEQQKVSDNAGLSSEDREAFDTIVEWGKTTETGDKSELLIKPSDLLWRRFSTTSDECAGKKCASYKSCHAVRAREEAADAGILVTNYHLFFLNLANGGYILPASDVVILDEAHEAADIARDLLGFKASEYAFRRIANDAAKRGHVAIAMEVREAAEELFEKLVRFHDSPHYKALLRWPVPIDPSRLDAAIDDYLGNCAKSHVADYAMRARATLRQGLEISDPNCVYWIEVKPFGARQEPKASLQARYVSIGPALENILWDAYRSVVAVSATLTTDGKFDFVRRELGAPAGSRELVVDSPFDFPRQAMLVVPPADDLPEPNHPDFIEVAARRTIEVIEACGGRTLGLFTSYKALNAVYDRVRRHFGNRIRVLRQGEMPTSLLTETFKKDMRSVLLGTSSFWTGIDVPGEALTGLVIDRLPFGSPEDPVTMRISETDPRGAFANYTVPKSILTLRQGIGRLIRSQRDVGAIVILDKRLTTKSYGARFLKSLPPMARARSTSEIASFLRSKGVAA